MISKRVSDIDSDHFYIPYSVNVKTNAGKLFIEAD